MNQPLIWKFFISNPLNTKIPWFCDSKFNWVVINVIDIDIEYDTPSINKENWKYMLFFICIYYVQKALWCLLLFNTLCAIHQWYCWWNYNTKCIYVVGDRLMYRNYIYAALIEIYSDVVTDKNTSICCMKSKRFGESFVLTMWIISLNCFPFTLNFF